MSKQPMSEWARAHRRWSEMASALSRVPEPENTDPNCVELKGERIHFAVLMTTPAVTIPEVAEKIELATTRAEGWEPTALFWRCVAEDLAEIQRRHTGAPVALDTIRQPLSAAAYTERITRAVLDAIILASRIEGSGGAPVAAVQAGEVVEVLLAIISLLLCQTRECSTPQGIRLLADKITRKLRRKITDARAKGLSLEMHQVSH